MTSDNYFRGQLAADAEITEHNYSLADLCMEIGAFCNDGPVNHFEIGYLQTLLQTALTKISTISPKTKRSQPYQGQQE